MNLLYLRLGAAALVLIVLGWVGLTLNGWRRDAARLPAVEQQFKAYQSETVAAAKRQAELNAQDERARSELVTQLSTASAAINALAARPIKEVTYRETVAGACPDPRISAEWIGLYNDTADAANRSTQPAH